MNLNEYRNLLVEEDLLNAPSDPKNGFVYLEGIVRKKAFSIMDKGSSKHEFAKRSYLGTVDELLDFFGFELRVSRPNLPVPTVFSEALSTISSFNSRLLLESKYGAGSSSKIESEKSGFSQRTRLTIENAEFSIRKSITSSDLSETQKVVLQRKLSEIMAGLRESNADKSSILSRLTFIAVALAGVTSFAADVNPAVENVRAVIEKIVVEEMETETLLIENEKQRLIAAPAIEPQDEVAP